MATRKFKHVNGLRPVGTIIKVTKTEYSTTIPGSFLLDGNYYWQTEDGTPAKDQLDVGDTFKVLSTDATYVYVEEVEVKRPSVLVVTIEKSKILAEAKKSKTLLNALKRLAPEAFDPDPAAPDWSKCKDYDTLVDAKGNTMIERRTIGQFKDHITLGIGFNWKLVETSGRKVLLGTPKKA
jgi:hypothetical protein